MFLLSVVPPAVYRNAPKFDYSKGRHEESCFFTNFRPNTTDKELEEMFSEVKWDPHALHHNSSMGRASDITYCACFFLFSFIVRQSSPAECSRPYGQAPRVWILPIWNCGKDREIKLYRAYRDVLLTLLYLYSDSHSWFQLPLRFDRKKHRLRSRDWVAGMLVTDAVWSSTFQTPTGHLVTRATLRKELFLFLETVWRDDELVLQKVKKSIGTNHLLFFPEIT